MVKTIAVIYGSDTSEWEVSCRSGEFVSSRIDEYKYDVYEIFARFGRWELVAMRPSNSMRVPFPEGSRPEVDKTDFSVTVFGEKVKFDYAYIMQHGAPGETGLLQGYLEMICIPFSTGSAFVTAVAFDKYSCKSYLRGNGVVKLADDVFIRKGDDIDAFSDRVEKELGFPVFVKPTGAGSSFGITKVDRKEDIPAAVRYAFTEGETVIAEKGLVGRELTCAVYKDAEGPKALPCIEVKTFNEWFDYEAKYNGRSEEICPAEIPDSLRDELQKTSIAIYTTLGCAGVVRFDYIAAEDGLYFLEANLIPGMTNASLVPKMVRAAGIDFTAFLTTVIENS